MRFNIPGFRTAEVDTGNEPMFRYRPVVSYLLRDHENRILGTFTDLTEIDQFIVAREGRITNGNARSMLWRIIGADIFAGYAEVGPDKPPNYFLRVEDYRG
jgi:hypothetical protein